jgi:hypothetical protein
MVISTILSGTNEPQPVAVGLRVRLCPPYGGAPYSPYTSLSHALSIMRGTGDLFEVLRRHPP